MPKSWFKMIGKQGRRPSPAEMRREADRIDGNIGDMQAHHDGTTATSERLAAYAKRADHLRSQADSITRLAKARKEAKAALPKARDPWEKDEVGQRNPDQPRSGPGSQEDQMRRSYEELKAGRSASAQPKSTQTGSRGGVYYITESGKKVYVKQ